MHVTALWRYPVKSMQGEALTVAEVGSRGIVGDRQWAVVDRRTGLTLTARREPALLFAAATLDDAAGGVRITVDGRHLRDDDDLSGWVGRPVALVPADPERGGTFETPLDPEAEDGAWVRWEGPAGSFHDSRRTQLSIVGEVTMRGWDVRRFRPNVVVSGGIEDGLIGRAVAIGDVALDVVKPIDRCVIVGRAQPGLPRDLEPLRTINRELATFLGVGALVTRAGRIAVGDEVV